MSTTRNRYDALIVGAGHNGLVAATLLAQEGLHVGMVERRSEVGGAAVSANVFGGTGVRLSRYSYLVSLFPAWLLEALGVAVELRPRSVASYTPVGDGGLLDRTGIELPLLEGLSADLYATMTQPLLSRDHVRALIGGDAFSALCERPLSDLIESTFDDDVIRGIVATDALIGTFAPMDDPELRQNRCFLYHVIGGPWNVPVGGMGALSGALAKAAQHAGVEIMTVSSVAAIDADAPSGPAAVRLWAGGELYADQILVNVAPNVLSELLAEPTRPAAVEGSQLKLNMVLSRLPRLKDPSVDPREAFAGTFHVNESYSQLQHAYAEAAAGRIPNPVPCEAYCHTLTDPSIMPELLHDRGAVSLTVFALHMPARLFRGTTPDGLAINHDEVKRAAVAATMESLNSVLAEPLEDCVLVDPVDGQPCIEAHTPIDLEDELGMPGGHIFHGDLSWPFAESADDVGRWGVETSRPNLWICGSGARRGGAVSGIPGHNAAMALLERRGR